MSNEKIRTQHRINSCVERAVVKCMKAKSEGKNFIVLKTSKDIQFEVRKKLEAEFAIEVPVNLQGVRTVTHTEEFTTMKLMF